MKNWYVINSKPKKEFQVERMFIEAGFEIYTPKYAQDKQIKPFFPGYQFLYFEYPEQYRLVKYTRGVKKVIGNETGPIPVSDKVIKQIRSREVNGLIELEKYGLEPNVGDEIEVMEGAMKGLRGVFQKEMTDKERVIILLNYVSYQGTLVIEKKKLKKIL